MTDMTAEQALMKELRYWRAERPDEWKMDEIIRIAEKALSAPDVAKLVEALEEARLTLEVMQGRGSSVKLTLEIIDRALVAHRKQGDIR